MLIITILCCYPLNETKAIDVALQWCFCVIMNLFNDFLIKEISVATGLLVELGCVPNAKEAEQKAKEICLSINIRPEIEQVLKCLYV